MKKRKNFLKITSFILGCVAICGISVLGVLARKENDNVSVSAEMELNSLTNANVTFDDYTDYSNFTPVWSFLESKSGNTSRPGGAEWHYLLDYDVRGYYNGRPFERLRVDAHFRGDFLGASVQSFVISVGTIQDFYNADYGTNFGLVTSPSYSRWTDNSNIFDYWFDYSHDTNYFSSLNFVDGDDIADTDLLFVLNTICTFDGYNNYTYDNVTLETYQQMVIALNDELNGLKADYALLQASVADAYQKGYDEGYAEGEGVGQNLYYQAYASGYSAGFADADNQDEVVVSIFSGILQVALVPINFFLAIFNFEILGINLSAFIRAIFTVVITIIVMKTVLGKGGGGSDS